ncbi:O-antigen ligase family protein [Colwellia chukchiensis]|uniref:hypothetical protein n=1 Tax=Colwellia chukchiensis TaxID=641665 RepID=UPI001301AAB9|nr:hypothetical protein [Colwellia chukchiensis]
MKACYRPQRKEATLFEKKVVFTFLFLLLPIFDMINGFLVVGGYISAGGLASPSQLGRLIATAILLFVSYRYKLNIIWAVIVVYPLCVEVIAGFIHLNDYGFLFGVMSSYKLIYLFFMCLVLSFYCQKPADISLLAWFLKLNLLMISCSLVFSLITGLGNETYGYGFGTKGFFASGNGIGVYMGVCSLIMLGFKQYGLYQNVRSSTLVFFAIATAIIGSKTALVFSLILLFLLVWYSKYRYLAMIITIILFIWGLPKLIEVFTVVFDIVIKRYELSESLLAFLGSGRVNFVEEALDIFYGQESIVTRLIIGSGAFLSFQNPLHVSAYDTLETDIFDILFMYGIVGVTVYLLFFIRLTFLLKHYVIFLLAAVLLFIHSLVAGHVIFNGLSVFVIAILRVLGRYLSQSQTSRDYNVRKVNNFKEN